MPLSLEAELDMIEAALAKACGGQAYSADGQSVQRVDFKALTERADAIRRRLGRRNSAMSGYPPGVTFVRFEPPGGQGY